MLVPSTRGKLIFLLSGKNPFMPALLEENSSAHAKRRLPTIQRKSCPGNTRCCEANERRESVRRGSFSCSRAPLPWPFGSAIQQAASPSGVGGIRRPGLLGWGERKKMSAAGGAGASTVSVLTPNGRRVTVRVGPSTALLQVGLAQEWGELTQRRTLIGPGAGRGESTRSDWTTGGIDARVFCWACGGWWGCFYVLQVRLSWK